MLRFTHTKNYTYDPCKYHSLLEKNAYIMHINIELSQIYCSIFTPYNLITKIPHILTTSLKKLEIEKNNMLHDIISNIYQAQYFIDFQEKLKLILYKIKELNFFYNYDITMINKSLVHLGGSILAEKIDITNNILTIFNNKTMHNVAKTHQICAETKFSIQTVNNSLVSIIGYNSQVASVLNTLSEKFIIKKVILNKHNANHQQILNNSQNLLEHQDELKNDIIEFLNEQSPTMPEFLYLTIEENSEI
ncbi:hypothetical protein [Candidatus Fokinia crypta]|nr:hypothetical protein [Candidatus Fokinia cryptica]